MCVLITEEEIKRRVETLASEIIIDYIGKGTTKINFLFILDGSFIFASDLARALSSKGMKLNISSLRIKSYESMVSGNVKIADISNIDLKYKHTLIVDDILDTGNTLKRLAKKLIMKNNIYSFEKIGIYSFEYCCLLRKDHGRCVIDHNSVKYIGFIIPDEFVIGYGLDLDGLYRELPYIRDINEDFRCQL